MFFDDRLATVLRQSATGERASRTQFRQLLDLLGSGQSGRDASLREAAMLRLEALEQTIPAAERASMIGEQGLRRARACRQQRTLADRMRVLAGDVDQRGFAIVVDAGKIGLDQH